MDTFDDLESIHSRHAAVQQKEIEGRLRGERAFKHLHGLLSALGFHHGGAPGKERFPQNQTVCRVIIHDETAHTAQVQGPRAFRRCRRSLYAQPNEAMERAALAEGALDPNLSAHECGQLL